MLDPEYQESIHMKLKIQMEPLESIIMKLLFLKQFCCFGKDSI